MTPPLESTNPVEISRTLRSVSANIAAFLLLAPTPATLPLLRLCPRPVAKALLLGLASTPLPAAALPLAAAYTVDALLGETTGWDEFAHALDAQLIHLGFTAPDFEDRSSLVEAFGRFWMEMGVVFPAAIVKASVDACDARGLPLAPSLALTILTVLPAFLAGTPAVAGGAWLRLTAHILAARPA